MCVHDFEVKYFDTDDVEHLLDTVKQKYEVKVDWTGRNFLGYTLDWNYEQGFIDLSMPKYVPKMLSHLNYTPSPKPQYSPHECFGVKYSKKGD